MVPDRPPLWGALLLLTGRGHFGKSRETRHGAEDLTVPQLRSVQLLEKWPLRTALAHSPAPAPGRAGERTRMLSELITQACSHCRGSRETASRPRAHTVGLPWLVGQSRVTPPCYKNVELIPAPRSSSVACNF